MMRFFRPLLQLAQNIIAGTRLALFMPVYLWSFKSSYMQVCLLLMVSLALNFAEDYLASLPNNYFNPYGLNDLALLYLLFFFSLSLIAYFNSRLTELTKLIIMFLAVVPVIWSGTMCLLYLSEKQTLLPSEQTNSAIFYIYSFWYLTVVFRLLRRYFRIGNLYVVMYVLLYVAINFPPLFLLPPAPLWYKLPVAWEQQEDKIEIDIESIYYAQDDLINKALTDVLENDGNKTDIYFVGFAGDAEEDVFMNEAASAKKILENHFNAHGRSLLLVNNIKTVKQYPLANRYNLFRAINKIALKMDTKDDVLFLFLTSHGTKKHLLSINFPQFRPNDIDANIIKHALDSANIEWRIIVISACYSGGFIESLKGPKSLIITSASPERTSFGCGHDGQYTYFGKAFFEDSLKEKISFVDAFDTAKTIIRERENVEGIRNSMPQISLGDEIKIKLAEMEDQFAFHRQSNWATTETK